MAIDKLNKILLFIFALILITYLPGLAGRVSGDRIVKNLGLPNWHGQDYAPQISPDGRFLVFQSDRPGSHDGQNLWFTMNRNYRDRLGIPSWTIPLPFFLPMTGPASKTMQIRGGEMVLKDPPGAFSINTDGFEGMVTLRYKAAMPVEIFFTSRAGRKTGRKGYDKLNIYSSRYTDNRWLPPKHLNEINGHFNDRMPLISADGKTLYFVSDRPGGYGANDIWKSSRISETASWTKPKNLGPEINTEYNEISPSLTPGEGTLIFSSDRPGGFGHYDFFAALTDGGRFYEPRNLGAPFNTNRDEEFITFTADGLWAYFSSDRRSLKSRGKFDLYRILVPEWLREGVGIKFTGLILDGKSRLPLGVEATIKVHYEKQTMIFTSRVFQKPPSSDQFNNFEILLRSRRIYSVEVSAPGYEPVSLTLDYKGNVPANKSDRRIIILQPIDKISFPVTNLITGTVVDASTKKGIPHSQVYLQRKGKTSRLIHTDHKGRFTLSVKKGADFTVTGSAKGYISLARRFKSAPALKNIIIPLKKGKSPDDSCLKNLKECLDRISIYFELNRSELRTGEGKKLDTVERIMKKLAGITIEILGNADATYKGPKARAFEYNKLLSIRRAMVVKKALINRGIAAQRLKVTGNSYLKPVCKKDTPACHARNRRVEFIRISR